MPLILRENRDNGRISSVSAAITTAVQRAPLALPDALVLLERQLSLTAFAYLNVHVDGHVLEHLIDKRLRGHPSAGRPHRILPEREAANGASFHSAHMTL
jgi:hypothetical protein